MIYIYCPSASKGARLLVERLRAMGADAKRIREYTPGAITWGEGGGNKYDELLRLARAGIPVPAHIMLPRHDTTYAQLWLGRTFNHQQARDLLHRPMIPDYYVEHVRTVREHRIHVFDEKVIRVQTKEPDGPHAHEWIRSASSGWTLKARPDLTALLPRGARELAKKAVAAMGYKLGGVDLAVKPDGKLIVWEVNSRPGLNEQTADAYAAAILNSIGTVGGGYGRR